MVVSDESFTPSGQDRVPDAEVTGFNPPRTKEEQGDYVERNGFLVPVRYANHVDAYDSGSDFYIRGQHPQDFDGYSDVLPTQYAHREFLAELNDPGREKKFSEFKSAVYDPHDHTSSIHILVYAYENFPNLSPEELRERLLMFNRRQTEFFCLSTGTNLKEFEKEASFSFWSALKGYNRTVVADSSIAERMHIFTRGDKFSNYTIVQNGQVEKSIGNPFNEELLEGLNGLVNSYKDIRNLKRFDSLNCPILEMQTLNGKEYFLQYLATNIFEEPDFRLDRKKRKNEMEATFVRGATSGQGEVVEFVIVKKPQHIRKVNRSNGYFQLYPYQNETMEMEILATKCRVGILRHADDSEFIAATRRHSSRSQFFKPKVALALPRKGKEMLYDAGKDYDDDEPIRVAFRVIADGRRAFLERID